MLRLHGQRAQHQYVDQRAPGVHPAAAQLDVTGDGAAHLGDQAELGPAGGVQGTDQLDDPGSFLAPERRGDNAANALPVGGLGRTHCHFS